MASKKITVGSTGALVGSHQGYQDLLSRKGIQCLLIDNFEVHDFESLVDGGTYTLGPPIQQQQTALSLGRPPRTPRKNSSPNQLTPPSTGKDAPIQTLPDKSPSSDEGQLEGLRHASDDDNTYMQCTSTPAAVELLQLLEDTIQDQKNEEEPNKFNFAARYVTHARDLLVNRKAPVNIGTNERFFTGAMASAINSVLQDGYCVLHQACLGIGATRSDLSATCINETDSWSTTLMVGEGKWNACNLREETRGQIFNELLRHRAIDLKTTHAPVLLLTFDKNTVEIDLAFPSTKGGKLESDHVVTFSDQQDPKKELFWTVRILRTNIADSSGNKNLPIVIRFISAALMKLYSWQEQNRVQYKMPMSLKMGDTIAAVSQYCGENVTIIEKTHGSKFVYKEYCYHLRQACDIMSPLLVISETDKRQPPPGDLLKALGQPYTEWQVYKGPFGTSVLVYPFIEGSSYSPSVAGWLKILKQIQDMHKIDFVHGDLLPRNVLFGTHGDGYVIDFDLSRESGATYVNGYNHTDFKRFPHDKACAGQTMTKDHDLHSLRQMSAYFFDLENSGVDLGNLDLERLIEFFQERSDLLPFEFDEMNDSASDCYHHQYLRVMMST
eukprot:CAMPEP_0202442810 /NCGR_PEP_ID=MMETSP1360-20130828/2163_1 /ASSEMBLY_ACC=CAM_ASM_000848 /TAXON_ID=515479 /ORGANISM="Licmophora paradoxa, Strain CCMP2313" /LENGTH=609 /DNA_ID=CAMNT_0049058271 /DNA_START=125 /DNA_END=1954 /DNA_ORIENTATION=-